MEITEIFNMLADGINPTTGEVIDVAEFGNWKNYDAFKKLRAVVSEEHRRVSKRGMYRKHCEEYPAHIVIVKSGYFYTAYNESAEILGQVMGYKVSLLSGHTPTTGGPDLCSIAERLRAAGLSYIAFNSEVIEDRYDGKNPFA